MTIFFVTYCNCLLIFLVWTLNQPGRWVTKKMSSSYQHHGKHCGAMDRFVLYIPLCSLSHGTPGVTDIGRLTPLAGLSDTEVLLGHTWHVVGPQFSWVAWSCSTVTPLWPHLMGHPFWPLQGSCLSQTVPSLLPSAALAAPASLSSLDIHHTCLPVFFPFLSIPTLPLIEMHHNVFFYNTVPLWYSIFNVKHIMLFLAQNHLQGLFKNSDQQLWVVEEGKPGQCK